MAARRPATLRNEPPQRQNTQAVGTPAPMRGLVANAPIYGTDAGNHETAIWLFNMIPREMGVSVRPGSKETVTGLLDKDALPADVRTLMYYNSVVAQSSGGIDFAFAVTNDGIFDVTAGGSGPHAKVLNWPIKDAEKAGWCSVLNYTNVAGDHFLLVCDEANGYYVFDGLVWTQGTVSTTGPISAPDPADLVQLVEWNARVWFVERDTAKAWFTDPIAFTGEVQTFDLGSRFKKGGHLVQLSTWTVDDGAGMDDKLVAVGSAGDLLVWELSGTFNPENSDDLRVVGRWFVGTVPEGRRVLSDWGGDVLIASDFGLLKLSALLGGMASLDDDSYITKNITRYFRSFMETVRDEYGWQLELNPAEGVAIVSVPKENPTSTPIQFCFNINTGAWSMFRDLDMRCLNKNGGGFFFGTSDGRVLQMTGFADAVSLDGLTGQTIVYSLLTHYSNVGTPANWKRVQFIRPSFIGQGVPTFGVQARYDFDLSEVLNNPPFIKSDAALWDAAVWDIDVWAGASQSYINIIGGHGMGRHIAIAMRGESSVELSLVGFDLMYDTGGML